MLPTELIDVALDGNNAVPRYLTRRDETWVRALQDLLVACEGRTRDDVDARLARARLPGASWRQRQAMTRLLLRLHGSELRSNVDPVAVRKVVFDCSAEAPGAPRDAVLARAAARLELEPRDVEAALYADLPGERLLASPTRQAAPAELIEHYNLTLLQGLVFRAESITARVRDGAKHVLRFARLQRLLVEVRATQEPGPDVILVLSGPLSLLRLTTKYGHAMARWLPALTRQPSWSLQARCRLGERAVLVRATHADPIGTTHELPRRFDSRLEELFFRDFAKLGSRWEILREAAPVTVGTGIACPDFVVVDEGRGLVVSVEIVGFWTPAYLESKRRLLANLPPGCRWLLCVDEELAAGGEADSWGAGAFMFRRRIDAAAFLGFLEGRCAGGRRAAVTSPSRPESRRPPD